jgi:hypothetical protein
MSGRQIVTVIGGQHEQVIRIRQDLLLSALVVTIVVTRHFQLAIVVIRRLVRLAAVLVVTNC